MQLLINNKNISLLNLNSNIFDKFLCPFVFYHKKELILVCSRRKKFFSIYSDIAFYSLNILTKKTKFIYSLDPGKYFNAKYVSFLSPNIINFKNFFYCFLQAKKKNSKGSKIVVLQSKDFKKWNEITLDMNNNFSIQTPSIFNLKKKLFLICSKHYKEFLIYDLKIKKKKIIINFKDKIRLSTSSRFYLKYSPQIINFKKNYFLIFSEWLSRNKSCIKIQTSKDLLKWNLHMIVLSKKKFKLISEPFIKKINKNFYLFFEFYKKRKWNLAYLKLKDSYMKLRV